MVKRIEKTITLTEMRQPVDETNLKPNVRKIGEYWTAAYVNLKPMEYSRRETTAYQSMIDLLISTRQNDLPKEIVIKMKK